MHVCVNACIYASPEGASDYILRYHGSRGKYWFTAGNLHVLYKQFQKIFLFIHAYKYYIILFQVYRFSTRLILLVFFTTDRSTLKVIYSAEFSITRSI